MLKDLSLLTLRLATGGLLASHGYVKLFGGAGKTAPSWMSEKLGPNFDAAVEEGGPEAFARTLDSMQIPEPEISAYLSGMTEFGGGLALMAGYKTRLVALPVIFNMLVAILKVHRKNGLYGQGGYELPGLLVVNTAALFLAGPGAISFKGLFGRHKGKKHDEKKDDDN